MGSNQTVLVIKVSFCKTSLGKRHEGNHYNIMVTVIIRLEQSFPPLFIDFSDLSLLAFSQLSLRCRWITGSILTCYGSDLSKKKKFQYVTK